MSDDKVFSEQSQALVAGGHRYAIVAARFNDFIVDKLLTAAVETLKKHGAEDWQVSVERVPGAFELPLTAQRLAQSEQYDAIIALGCVIRGDTPHFDYVCAESARGIGEVALKFNLPVIYGVLTTDTVEQAEQRAESLVEGETGDNKGKDAAMTAMEMLALLSTLQR